MPNLFEHFTTSAAYVHIIFIKIVQASEMPNLFEHFATSAAYVHEILFINIVQASEMPNLFEHFTTSAAYVQVWISCFYLLPRLLNASINKDIPLNYLLLVRLFLKAIPFAVRQYF